VHWNVLGGGKEEEKMRLPRGGLSRGRGGEERGRGRGVFTFGRGRRGTVWRKEKGEGQQSDIGVFVSCSCATASSRLLHSSLSTEARLKLREAIGRTEERQ
jgi:hypothetical protein